MRENDINEVVLVINHPGGVCSAGQGLSCQEVLPAGVRLIVWAPPYIEEGQPRVLEGAAQ
jgi:SCP1.201-like deaminase